MITDEKRKKILEQLADFSFFQIEVVEDLEFEGKVYKDVKQRNNNSILTPYNWEQHKDTFFNQRLEKYSESYTVKEKINLELKCLENLYTNTTDYEILKQRYKDFLQSKIDSPQETPEPQEKPQPGKTETANFNFTNNFDDIKEADVYNHFKKLVDKRMLTNEELNEYLLKAFQEKTPPENLFKLNNPRSKSEVRKVFHYYFKSIAQSPHGKQSQYVRLLTDYFEGYKFQTTKTNFSK